METKDNVRLVNSTLKSGVDELDPFSTVVKIEDLDMTDTQDLMEAQHHFPSLYSAAGKEIETTDDHCTELKGEHLSMLLNTFGGRSITNWPF